MCNISDYVYQKNIEDISLTEGQRLEINALLEDCDERMNTTITDGIEDLSINSHNFDKAKERIVEIIKQEKEKGDK